MKKNFFLLAFMLIPVCLFGQNKFESSGNVGIGTLSPAADLEVNGRFMVGGANLDVNASLGNLSYLSNSGKMLIGWNRSQGMGETNFISNQGLGGSGGFSFYNYTNSGELKLLMLMNGNGNIGIGTNAVSDRFAVDGRIKAREVIVTDMGWADHVFDDRYRLPKLSEVSRYITINKHLPGIPSAKEVSESGVRVGEMQARLLEKIEELTLHVIAQEKRIDLQEKEIKIQKKRNNQLTVEMRKFHGQVSLDKHIVAKK